MCFSTWLSTGLYSFLKLAWSSWVSATSSGLTDSCFYGIYFMGTSRNAFLQQPLLVQPLRFLLLLYLCSLRLLDKQLCSQHSYSAFVHLDMTFNFREYIFFQCFLRYLTLRFLTIPFTAHFCPWCQMPYQLQYNPAPSPAAFYLLVSL